MAARAVFRDGRRDLFAMLSVTTGGAGKMRAGNTRDVELSSQLDVSEHAPRLEGEVLVASPLTQPG